jgi:hypothetical protein
VCSFWIVVVKKSVEIFENSLRCLILLLVVNIQAPIRLRTTVSILQFRPDKGTGRRPRPVMGRHRGTDLRLRVIPRDSIRPQVVTLLQVPTDLSPSSISPWDLEALQVVG